MASGWAPDGAVQSIDDTIADAVLRARAMMASGEGADDCVDCGEPIPQRRRAALPGPGPAWHVRRSATPRSAAWESIVAEARIANCADRMRYAVTLHGTW